MPQTPLAHRILIIDDNRAIRDDFRKIFAAPGTWVPRDDEQIWEKYPSNTVKDPVYVIT